ncbi:hypothetical protein [Mesorhizobium neociceri]|uniref:Uncharacterized protein n=1 Tax=Mesorhizobium neociceri TaxID=1307853 RepID=A0A838B993_9HYPH|nr:hypothetical protein [Mesorhizobium neociceri]MBA1143176.1 hypothetical protein [Mesorhizobium neociceri]
MAKKKSKKDEPVSEDARLAYSWDFVQAAWVWRLRTCDPAEKPALQAKADQRAQIQEEVHRRLGWEVRWFPSFHETLDLDEMERSVMGEHTPAGAALRVELGLPYGLDRVPTEEERILAEIGDGYMTPAQRKRLRYLRKHREQDQIATELIPICGEKYSMRVQEYTR